MSYVQTYVIHYHLMKNISSLIWTEDLVSKFSSSIKVFQGRLLTVKYLYGYGYIFKFILKNNPAMIFMSLYFIASKQE